MKKLIATLLSFMLILSMSGIFVACSKDDEEIVKDPMTNYYEGEEKFNISKWQTGVTEDIFTITDEADGVTKIDYMKLSTVGYPQVVSVVEGEIDHFNYLVLTLKASKENLSVMIQAPFIYGDGEDDKVSTLEVTTNLDNTQFVTYCIEIQKGSRPQLNGIDGVWIFPEPGIASSSCFGTFWIEETYFTTDKVEGDDVVQLSSASSSADSPVNYYGDNKQWSNEYTWTNYNPTTNESGEIDVIFNAVGTSSYATLVRQLSDIELSHDKLEFDFTNLTHGGVDNSVTQITFNLRGDKNELIDSGLGYTYWTYHESQIGEYLQSRDGVSDDGQMTMTFDIKNALNNMKDNCKDGVTLVLFIESRPDSLYASDDTEQANPLYDGKGSMSVNSVKTYKAPATVPTFTAPSYSAVEVDTVAILKSLEVSDSDGTKHTAVITVEDPNGGAVAVTDNEFTPTVVGYYKVTYTVTLNDIDYTATTTIEVVAEITLENVMDSLVLDLEGIVSAKDRQLYSIQKIEEMEDIISQFKLDCEALIDGSTDEQDTLNEFTILSNDAIDDINAIGISEAWYLGDFGGDDLDNGTYTVTSDDENLVVSFDAFASTAYSMLFLPVIDYTYQYDRVSISVTALADINIVVRLTRNALETDTAEYGQDCIMNNNSGWGDTFSLVAGALFTKTISIDPGRENETLDRIEIYFANDTAPEANTLTFSDFTVIETPTAPVLGTLSSLTPLIVVEGDAVTFTYESDPTNTYQGLSFNLQACDYSIYDKIRFTVTNTGGTEFVLSPKFVTTLGDGYAGDATIASDASEYVFEEWLWGSQSSVDNTTTVIDIFVNSNGGAMAGTLTGSFTITAELIKGA